MNKVVTNISRINNQGGNAAFRVHVIPGTSASQIGQDPEIQSLFGSSFQLSRTSVDDIFVLSTSLEAAF